MIKLLTRINFHIYMKKFAKSASFFKNYFLKVNLKLYETTIKILQHLTVIYKILQGFSKIYFITFFSQMSTSSNLSIWSKVE